MSNDARGRSMSGEGESFGSRWSRLKREARESVREADDAREAPDAPAAFAVSTTAPGESVGAGRASPTDDAPGDAGQTPPALPSLDSLQGLAGEYHDFLRPEVGDEVRRAALKKLFADPHFNQIDLLEAYSGDYTQFDPIPAAMMASLEQARHLWVSSDERDGNGESRDESRGQDGMRMDAAPAPDGGEASTAAEPDTDPLAEAIAQAEAGQPALPDWEEASLRPDDDTPARTSKPEVT